MGFQSNFNSCIGFVFQCEIKCFRLVLCYVLFKKELTSFLVILFFVVVLLTKTWNNRIIHDFNFILKVLELQLQI